MIRLWLLALLVLTAAIAAGVLVVKYQLELLRTGVHAEIEQRTGVLLNVDNLRVNGLTGLRLDQLHMAVKTDSGPAVDIHVPEALLFVNLLDLIQGRVVLDRLQLDDARIRVSRPVGHDWLTNELGSRAGLESEIPFRIRGRNCTLEVEGIVGRSGIAVERLDFDLNRLSDSPHIIANVRGHMGEQDGQGFEGFARFASMEDFDVRVQSEGLTADDLAVFFPESAGLLASGRAQPSVRVSGYPRKAMVVSLELPFQDLALRGEQRIPVPAEGQLTALASYDRASRELILNSARTIAPGFEGRVEGTVAMSEALPAFDLRLEVEQLPVNDVLQFVMDEWLEQYGTLAVEAPEPYKFFVTLQGNTEDARLGVEAQMGNGALRFQPADSTLPSADLNFSLMSVAWDSEGSFPTGNLALSGGTIRHAPSKLSAENISGNLSLTAERLMLDPLVAQVAGNTIMGEVEYQLADKSLAFNLSGMLGAAEEIDAIKNHPKLAIYGPVAIEALSGTITPGKTVLDGTLDLTRAGIDWEWWLSKAPGIGARLDNFHAEIRPRESASITCTASLDTTTIDTEFQLQYANGTWNGDSVSARSDNVTMGTANKVLNIPYTISGGTGTGAQLEWRRTSLAPDAVELKISGGIDTLTLVPAGTREPIAGKDIRVDTVVLKDGEDRTGTLNVHAETAELPPMGTPWLLPLRAEDDPSMEEFPPLERAWAYNLSAASLSYPPWEGTAFTGKAYNRVDKDGFEQFQATIDGGTIGGMSATSRPENVRQLDVHWDKIPAGMLLAHLKLPPVFSGTMTGGIKYSVDEDDRGTLRGSGYFDVVDGQFSADYLFAQFERQIEERAITLPPSLKFTHFTSDVVLEGDVVKTSDMLLESEAVDISGEGQFVLDGDIDYHLRLELPPATAQGVPALRTYFNLDGLRHSQNDLKLAFHVYGPRFGPKVELDGMPSVGDTIVSGAVEVTTDVMKVVDLPRQILLDLFKIGGGIVGAGGNRTPGAE